MMLSLLFDVYLHYIHMWKGTNGVTVSMMMFLNIVKINLTFYLFAWRTYKQQKNENK